MFISWLKGLVVARDLRFAPAMSQADLRALAELIWREVASRTDVVSGRTIEMPPLPPDHPVPPPVPTAAQFPVLRHFERALEAALGGPLAALARQLRESAAGLIWSQNPGYSEETVGRHFLDNYAYALLTGPEGPITCPLPYGGFILLGPDLHYPDHKHAPREVYLVLTPGARWSLDGGAWFDVAPGTLIFHDSWQRHATRTGDGPLLAFVAWLDESRRDGIEI